MEHEDPDWIDRALDKIYEKLEAVAIKLRERYPPDSEVVWDDHAATNWTGGSEGFSAYDPQDFQSAAINLADILRDLQDASFTDDASALEMFADALNTFEDPDEIVAVDMVELIAADNEIEEDAIASVDKVPDGKEVGKEGGA